MEDEEQIGTDKRPILSEGEKYPVAMDVLPKSTIKILKTKGAVFLEVGEEVKVKNSWLGVLEIIDRDGDEHEWNVMNSKDKPSFVVVEMPDPMELLEIKMAKLEQKLKLKEEQEANYVYTRIT